MDKTETIVKYKNDSAAEQQQQQQISMKLKQLQVIN